MLLLLVSLRLLGQVDTIGSGRAVRFDGTDDYIDLGNIYDDIQFPLTISAWIYVEPSSKYIMPIFASQDNASLYNGFWFCLSATNLFFEYGDGRGEQSSAYRRGKSAPVSNLQNRWMHVSAVVKSGNDIQLYVNGHNVGGSYTGSSDQPMASSYPLDVAKIGYFYTNSVVHRFYGTIDEVRVWNKALADTELRESMCRRLTGDEPGLIGHWHFDEVSGSIAEDNSSNSFDGTLLGNPSRVFSGAPLGNESLSLYTAEWTGVSLTKGQLTVREITGSPYGIHIYSIPYQPSQTGGLDIANIGLPYYGVFLADDGTDNYFDIDFVGGQCLHERWDNSEAPWQALELYGGIKSRIELIRRSTEGELEIDLGPDPEECQQEPIVLQTHLEATGRTFLWNTGETTPEITVTSSGVYSVEVSEGCLAGRDTIRIAFEEHTLDIDLGEDVVECDEQFVVLEANSDAGNTFRWSTGDTTRATTISSSGTYALEVREGCHIGSDTVQILFSSLPSFSLGQDLELCKMTPIVIKPDIEHGDSEFTWSDGSHGESFYVSDFGTYWLTVKNECGALTDSVSFVQRTLTQFTAYNFISPNKDNHNQFFTVDENVVGSYLAVFSRWGKPLFESFDYQNDWDGGDLPSGIYYYLIRGECFEPIKGTVTILR